MKKLLVRLFTLIIVFGLVVTPALAQTPTPTDTDRTPPTFETPSRPTPQLLPQEIRDLFKDGMSIEEFLANNKGPIPNALLAYANLPVTVIVQLKDPSLISFMEKQEGISGAKVGIASQKSYVAELLSTQDAVISQIQSAGIDAIVISHYTKALNGFMARVTFNDLRTLRALPAVKSISKAPEHSINLSNQVPLSKAELTKVLELPGFTGQGITIAVIDTGIDYTHAMLGGPGDPLDYTSNDPNIIEPDTFPTVKVIGGYDFAGTNYDASTTANSIPVPDPDPLDENGHGTHVASIAAGLAGDDLAFHGGVAPDASLFALKVFGVEGSTNLVVDAIEWVLDYNLRASVEDRIDVINMSLGSSFGPAIVDDPEYLAVEAANAAGVFVVASSGNAGDVNYVTGSPANTDSALSVASSTTGLITAPYITYLDPADSVNKQIPYTTSANPFTTAIAAELVDVVDIGDTSGLLCSISGLPETSLAGKIALINRGTCNFSIKINNAEALGAVAAIIYNNVAGSINMDTTGSSLPAGSILQTDGLTLKDLAPIEVTIGPDSLVASFTSPTPADTISDFSSRGPRGYDSMLKPEITAPGSDIFAAKMGSGNQGVSMSGTSMAAPYVAGVAALMKQAHPTWTNEQIKAAMMNTAVDLADSGSRQVPRQGAGRVDVPAAINTNVVAVGDPNFVSLNWGLLELPQDTFSSEKYVTLHNYGDTAVTLQTGAVFTSPSILGATITPDPSSITIPAASDATVKFTLDLDVTALPLDFGTDISGNYQMEEYYGYVNFTGVGADLSLPFYFVPRPYPEITETAKETKLDFANPTDFGYVDLQQAGPLASNLWAFPVTLVSDNNPAVMDMADLRYVGMDYGGNDSTYGDIFVPAFNMWGSQHAEQAYWSEVDLWIYGDASEPVVNFNYNYADILGAAYPNNDWIVIQVDFNDENVYLASPYNIYADFNSGFQEWYLPTAWSWVTDSFRYEVKSYDWYATEDFAGEGYFDITRPPLAWNVFDASWSERFSPHNEPFSMFFRVNNLDGYLLSAPKGIMLVDYYGKPGTGQATFWPISLMRYLHLPLISK